MIANFEHEMAEAIRDCLTKLADISRRMGETYRAMEKRNEILARDLDAAQEKADLSQRREVDLVDENQRLREDNAILRGEFQIVADTANRASIGAQVSRNLRRGEKPFNYGEPHKSINADVQESAKRLEEMERQGPVPFQRIEQEMQRLVGAN